MPVPPESEASFRLPLIQDGQPCVLYFFGRWSGYAHPVRPRDPLPWLEALAGKDHCQALYCRRGSAELMVAFRAVGYTRSRWTGRAPMRPPSGEDRYYQVAHAGDQISLGSEMAPSAAAIADAYVLFSWTKEGQTSRAEIIEAVQRYRYDYTYNEKGRLLRVLIVNAERTTVLDY